MPATPRPGLLRAVLTLLAGGALAQALPLLLGPLLTRQYSPQDFGLYHLFAAVAANLAVVACGRYEFALPLATDDNEAQALRTLAWRLCLGVAVLAAVGGMGWAAWTWHRAQSAAGATGATDSAWPLSVTLALGPAVLALGAVSLATLWATRARAFHALAAARVLQHGGGAALQALAGWLHAGVVGLVWAPIAAAAAAAVWLRLPLAVSKPDTAPRLLDVARRHRDFPLLNTPHAFAGALQDTLALALLAAVIGPAAAGFWGLALRYLKAPATLVGSAVSQALYPQLAQHGPGPTPAARAAVRRVMLALAAVALPLVALLMLWGPWLFTTLFGPAWAEAGLLARALAPYIGLHFVASPLAVVTIAWGAQAWALKLAAVGQVVFIVALAVGLHLGGLAGAGWAVSLAMLGYFGVYFVALVKWPVTLPIH